jgi:hypothetical protein
MKIQWRTIWCSKHQAFDQIEEIWFSKKMDALVYQTRQSCFGPMCSVTVRSVGPSPAKLDSLVSETGGSEISRTSDKSSEMMTVDPNDWRTPLVHYLENPSHIANRKVWRQALKYVMFDNTLYRRIIDGLLLK